MLPEANIVQRAESFFCELVDAIARVSMVLKGFGNARDAIDCAKVEINSFIMVLSRATWGCVGMHRKITIDGFMKV